MATTLTYGATTVTMPDDLLWPDEFGWQPVAQSKRRGITGALLLQSAALVGGRPITLQGSLPRSVAEQVATAAALPGQQFTLTYRGVAHAVIFDHEAGAFRADPVFEVADPIASDYYTVTLRFLKV